MLLNNSIYMSTGTLRSTLLATLGTLHWQLSVGKYSSMYCAMSTVVELHNANLMTDWLIYSPQLTVGKLSFTASPPLSSEVSSTVQWHKRARNLQRHTKLITCTRRCSSIFFKIFQQYSRHFCTLGTHCDHYNWFLNMRNCFKTLCFTKSTTSTHALLYIVYYLFNVFHLQCCCHGNMMWINRNIQIQF